MKISLRRIATVLPRIYYYGRSFQCPYCGTHLRRFLPFGDDHPVLREMKVLGAGHRPNALCPVCRSLDRDRLLYLYLSHRSTIFHQQMRVLHVAPEKPLENLLRRQAHLDYVTTDLSRDDVQVKADLNDLPFPDNTYDAVICNHVLEYLPDDLKALAEIYRVMKPGGWAIVMEQIALKLETTFEDHSVADRSERYATYGEPGHQRLYGRDYDRRIAQVGFRVEVFRWSNGDEGFGGQTNTYGLLEGECVYIAFKPK